VIVITGDAIDDRRNLSLLDEFLAMVGSTPRIAIIGNWEHWAGIPTRELRRVYESRGATLLLNESVELRIRDRRVLFTGVDDSVAGQPDLPAAITVPALPFDSFLLAHCPVFRDTISNARTPEVDRFRFLLSGHTHGGQAAPFGWAPVRPPGSGRYWRGWYQDHSLPMYVSSGLGTSIIRARFCVPPEIAVFDVF
jgi:uncharacterized protein